ncbi:MAG: ATP-binding cassette family protein, partial [Bacteroidetes bacterium]
ERDLFAEEKELEKSISEQQEILQKNKEILDENAKELTQKSTLKEALQKEIQEIKTDFLQQQTQFESNILAQGFENKADFTNAILTLETEKNLQKQAQELKENEVSTQKKWQENLDLLKETENKNLAVDSLENIENQVVELKKLQKELQQNIGKISEQLRQHEKLEQEFADLQQKIDVLKQKHHRWEQLNALIGSADGKKFKIFAQSLTLAKLVGLANRHLEKLNVRYKIRKNPNESMELLIIDTYQADHVRSMKTLSGGESFLVSLALALGLSDLASRHTNIDSLFIDEGFGTLDQDTLQMVLGTLANLQASGKMVGIISHVEGLKEAISTKIHVKKLAGGVSTIEVSG